MTLPLHGCITKRWYWAMVYGWMWTLGKSRRNGVDSQRQACGFQDEETVEVEREKWPTGSLLHMCEVLLKPSQPLAKGLVNPCGWGTKDSTKCTVYVFPGQGAILKDHLMQFRDHWVFFNISVLKYIIYTRRSSLFICSIVFVSSWVCGNVQRKLV